MDSGNPGPTQPEKEHSLPTTFIDKREDFYVAKSNISKARIIRDTRMLKEAVIEYLTTLDYMCNRIKPKLRGKYRDEITAIQAYIITALRTVGTDQGIPDKVIDELDKHHEIVTAAMVNYGFDQITPTVLNI